MGVGPRDAGDVVERVLIAAEQIPPGRVASYGDLAGLVGTGPRQVGAILSRFGHAVPWWRVTNAQGDLPPRLSSAYLEHWAAEGIVPKPHGSGCRIADYRVDLSELHELYVRAAAQLDDKP